MAEGVRKGPRDAGRESPPKQPHVQTAEQERASVAWKWVEDAKKCIAPKKYGTLSRKLPTYLRTSGFEQTMAFLFSKSEGLETKAEGMMFAQFARHCLRTFRRNGMPLLDGQTKVGQMMKEIVGLQMDESRRAAQEAMRIAEWLKRFAPTELGEENE